MTPDAQLTSLEGHETPDAGLDLDEQGIDIGNQSKHSLDFSGHEGVSAEVQTIDDRDNILDQDAEVNLELDNGIGKSLDINVGVGAEVGYYNRLAVVSPAISRVTYQ